MPDELRRLLITLRGQFSDVDYRPAQIQMALEHRTDLLKYPEDQWLESSIDALIGKGPWLTLVPCEVWTAEALEQLNASVQDIFLTEDDLINKFISSVEKINFDEEKKKEAS